MHVLRRPLTCFCWIIVLCNRVGAAPENHMLDHLCGNRMLKDEWGPGVFVDRGDSLIRSVDHSWPLMFTNWCGETLVKQRSRRSMFLFIVLCCLKCHLLVILFVVIFLIYSTTLLFVFQAFHWMFFLSLSFNGSPGGPGSVFYQTKCLQSSVCLKTMALVHFSRGMRCVRCVVRVMPPLHRPFSVLGVLLGWVPPADAWKLCCEAYGKMNHFWGVDVLYGKWQAVGKSCGSTIISDPKTLNLVGFGWGVFCHIFGVVVRSIFIVHVTRRSWHAEHMTS